MDIKMNGRVFIAPDWTKTVVEDMEGNFIAIDKKPSEVNMYKYPLCPVFPPRRIFKRVISFEKIEKGGINEC